MVKPRLQRLELLFTKCPVYFLTTCTAERRRILANEKTHEAFSTFATHAAEHRVHVGRYVIMPDHLHLFVAFGGESPSLSEWMKAMKRTVAKKMGEGAEDKGWQKGFFDHVLRSEESYEQKWLYVRENPVRAGLVRKWDEWPYQGEIHPLVVQKL